MERTNFIQVITDSEQLAAQPLADLKKCADEYPYASVVQLLHCKKLEKLTNKELQKILLHFDNPLHLSVRLGKFSHKLSTESEDVQIEGRDTSHKLKAKEQSAKKKMRVAVPSSAATKETGVVSKKEDIDTKEEQSKKKEFDKVIEDKEEITAKKKRTDSKRNVEKEELKVSLETKNTSSEEEDVLRLIQDLPEENPIPSSEPDVDTETKTTEFKQEEDPGDLMVMLSFTDWLEYFKSKKENEEEDKKGKDAIRSAWQKEKLAEAMDDEEDVVPDEIFEKAMKSVSFGDGLVTEPLAELYVNQGKTEKAIELYKKLSLLNPEKKVYFASRIKELHLLKE